MVSERPENPHWVSELAGRLSRVVGLGTCLVAVLVVMHPLMADEVSQPIDEAHTTSEGDPQTPLVDKNKVREGTATAGVILLLGVVALGLLVIAGALIAGARLRRLAREGERAPSRQDELWYLRHPDSDDKQQATAAQSARNAGSRDAEPPTNSGDTPP